MQMQWALVTRCTECEAALRVNFALTEAGEDHEDETAYRFPKPQHQDDLLACPELPWRAAEGTLSTWELIE